MYKLKWVIGEFKGNWYFDHGHGLPNPIPVLSAKEKCMRPQEELTGQVNNIDKN